VGMVGKKDLSLDQSIDYLVRTYQTPKQIVFVLPPKPQQPTFAKTV
jgi:hypothetical protein